VTEEAGIWQRKKKETLEILGRKINGLHEWGNSQMMLSE
jgi:hypothetical protein